MLNAGIFSLHTVQKSELGIVAGQKVGSEKSVRLCRYKGTGKKMVSGHTNLCPSLQLVQTLISEIQ